MLPKPMMFSIVVLFVVVWTLSGLPCAVAESTTPKAATSPQKGTAKSFLSPEALDMLRKRLATHWNPPHVKNPEEIIVRIRIDLKPDGTFAGPPKVMTTGTSKDYLAARDSAVSAIFRSQPFDMLPTGHYNLWKEIEITFDPRDMVRR